MNQSYDSPYPRRYNVIVFFSDMREYPNPLKYRNVSNLRKLGSWIEHNIYGGRDWIYMNLYDARTREYVGRFKNPTNQ